MTENREAALVAGSAGRVPIRFNESVAESIRPDILVAPHFTRWLAQCASRFDLRGVVVRDAARFGRRIGFILVEADAWHEGRSVPGIALLRGDSVAVLVILRAEGMADRIVLVSEPRLPVACTELLSIPAGMLDGGAFASTAIRELAEEVGEDLSVREEQLVSLGQVFLSPGGCDEAIGLYYTVLSLSAAAIDGLDGRPAGCAEERENIRVRVVELDALPRMGIADAKTLLAWHLYKAADAAARVA